MSIREELVEAVGDDELLFADGFDEAIKGYVEKFGSPPVVLYDRNLCIEILVRDGCSYEEATEHFDFNVIGSYVGDRTPAFATLSKNEKKQEAPGWNFHHGL